MIEVDAVMRGGGPALVVSSSAEEVLSVLGDAFADIRIVPGGTVSEALTTTPPDTTLLLWDGCTAADAAAASAAAHVLQVAVGLHVPLDAPVASALGGLSVRSAARWGQAGVLLLDREGATPVTEDTLTAARLAASATPASSSQETLEKVAVARAEHTHDLQELASTKARLAAAQEDLARIRERNRKIRDEKAEQDKTLVALGRHWLGRRALLATDRQRTGRRSMRSLALTAAVAGLLLLSTVAVLLGAEVTAVLLAVLLLLNAATAIYLVYVTKQSAWERRESTKLVDSFGRRLDRAIRRVDVLINTTEAGAVDSRTRFEAQEARLTQLIAASHEARRAVAGLEQAGGAESFDRR